jgi:hypothetical protein
MDNQNFPKLTSITPSSLDASDEVEAVQNNVGRAFFSALVHVAFLLTFGAGLKLGLNGIWPMVRV